MCTEKQYIYNKHTNRYLAVKCGHCAECNLERNAKLIDAINREDALNDKRPFFLTLTYSDPNLPLMSYYYDDDRFYISAYSDSVRKSYVELVDSIQLPLCRSERAELLGKFLAPFNARKYNRLPYPDNVFPVVNTRDIQLFFKRLTKQLYSHGKDSLYRKFYISEYGPIHYRPHYHAILWLSEEQADFVREHLSTLWPLGFSDFQRSSGGVASYVSTYTTSDTKLPAILQLASTRPRKAHSRFLGLPLVTDFIQHVDGTSVFQESQKFLQENFDTKSDYPPTAVFENALFPKCPRFTSCCVSALNDLYTIFTEVRRCLNYKCIKEYYKLDTDKLKLMCDYVVESGFLSDFNRDPNTDFPAFVYTSLIVSKKVATLASFRYRVPLAKITSWHVQQYVTLIKEYYHQKGQHFYRSLHSAERMDVADYNNIMSIPSPGLVQTTLKKYLRYEYDLSDKITLPRLKEYIRAKDLAKRFNIDDYKLLDMCLPSILFAYNAELSFSEVNEQVGRHNDSRRVAADCKVHDRMKHKVLNDLNDVLLQQFIDKYKFTYE